MNAHILIVEDDPALNQMLALHFEDEGYEVEGALTCAEAMEQVAASAFDLLLLDFVPVNCAAIVDSLLESELFGHEKGAFTGAQSRKTDKYGLKLPGR